MCRVTTQSITGAPLAGSWRDANWVCSTVVSAPARERGAGLAAWQPPPASGTQYLSMQLLAQLMALSADGLLVKVQVQGHGTFGLLALLIEYLATEFDRVSAVHWVLASVGCHARLIARHCRHSVDINKLAYPRSRYMLTEAWLKHRPWAQ
jgi:hypothetical protein